MKTSESILKIFPALVQAQSKIKGAKADADNPYFKSKYADMASVVEALKEPFKDAGLAYIQGVSEDHKNLVTRILHTSGEWIETIYPISCKDWANPQTVGSSVTYAKRYGLQAAAGIPSIDDDGNLAAQKPQQAPAARPAQQPAKPTPPPQTGGKTNPASPSQMLKDKLGPQPSKPIPNFAEQRAAVDRKHTIETKGFDPEEEMPF